MVLEIDELCVDAGQRLAVLGPNGSGKTTLLRLLAGIEPPTEGTVTLDDKVSEGLSLSARRSISYVTQEPALLTTTVRRNVELPLAWRDIPRQERRQRAMASLERLGIGHLADRAAQRLSGGERQRVNLARSLAIEPSVLLLDEPAAALDPEARGSFLDDLDHVLAEHTTTVVHVSHRPEEAVRGADRVAILDGGTMRQLGSPIEVFLRPADAGVAKVVGYHNVLPATVDATGAVVLNGQTIASASSAMIGAVTLAVWAHGVRIVSPGQGSLIAVVQAVTPGPGRWEITLRTGNVRLIAHHSAAQNPASVGQSVGLQLLPDLLRLVSDLGSE